MIAGYKISMVSSTVYLVFRIIPMIRDHARDCAWGASTEEVCTPWYEIHIDVTDLPVRNLKGGKYFVSRTYSSLLLRFAYLLCIVMLSKEIQGFDKEVAGGARLGLARV